MPRKTAETAALAKRQPTARSRVSNGSEVLPGIDGRTAMARRYYDILAAITSDQGGLDRLSEARLQLCRRFSAAAVLAESLEAKLARGEPIDLQEHALLCSSLVRLGTRIGIDRRAKNVTPTLQDYLESQVNTDDGARP